MNDIKDIILWRKLVEQVDKDSSKKDGFHIDIENETIENTAFRRVLFSAPTLQLVVMSLNPGEDIGLEIHNDDQFIRVDEGSGTALIGEKEYPIKDGSAIIVPAGSKHNITAGDDGIKIYTVYGSNHHPDMAVHKTKDEAQKAESK